MRKAVTSFLKSTGKRYAIIECPGCCSLQLVNSSTRSHRCPYCAKVIRLEWSKVKTLHFTHSARDASRIIMKLKSRRTA